MRFRINLWRRVFGGISINVTEFSKPALFKHCLPAMLIWSEMEGRLNVTLLSLDQHSGIGALPLNLLLGANDS